MASTAGQLLVAGRIPGERIATDIETADSATFTTTETVLHTVVAPVVDGRTYRVKVATALNFSSQTVASRCSARIREDSSSGQQLQGKQVQSETSTGTFGIPVTIEAEYTADATENKTFVYTGARSAGDATLNREAASDRPSYMYVDYIRG